MFTSITKSRSRRRALGALTLAAAALLSSACGEMEEQAHMDDPGLTTVASSLSPMCQVSVQGVGTVDVETDYIPHVVACENGNAPFEALKAQAIAARTYAKFKMETSGSLIDGQGDQVYSCGREPSAEHIRAAQETAGQVLTHNNTVLASFYVSGVYPSTTSCVPTAADKSRASSTDRRVEAYVTYNRGKIGNGVQPSSLGHPANPRNRGCMSQNGSSCLADQGKSHMAILRYYYGDDVRVAQLGGSCGGAATSPSDGSGVVPPEGGDTSGDPNDGSANDPNSCADVGSTPQILPRSAWNARPATRNRAQHTPNRISIHHTVQSTRVSGASAVRQIQNWHMDGNGWWDIGYHFVVDRDGTIYAANPEGRQGAHVANGNSGNLGVAMIANFENETPSDAQFNATARLVRHLSEKYSIPLDRDHVKGHGEQNSTACPGRNMRSQLDRLVEVAGADTVCNTGSGDDQAPVEFEYETPDIELEGDLAEYPYVRITVDSGQREAYPLDALSFSTGSETFYATEIVSQRNVENAGAALGEKDVDSCDNYDANAARVQPGGQLVLKFAAAPLAGQALNFVDRAVTSLGDCRIRGQAKLEVSRDQNEWVVLAEGKGPNSTLKIPAPGLTFVRPQGDNVPTTATFAVEASHDIVRVEYYAERWPLGDSSEVGDNFTIEYTFTGKGRRLISAWGYDEEGRAVASAERYVTVGEGLQFIAPRDGLTYKPDIAFQVTAPEDVERVVYMVDGQSIGESSNGELHFRVADQLSEGNHKVAAIGYDASGNPVGEHEIDITVSEDGSGFRFATPSSGGSYRPNLQMVMEVANPDVVRVSYYADPDYLLGTSEDAGAQFAMSYTFNQLGERLLTAKGYDAEGNEITQTSIPVTLTDENGVVPGGSNTGGDPGAANPGDVQINQSMADALVREARKYDGRSSGGYCWRETYNSMTRAGYTYSQFSPLAQAGTCSSGGFWGSAYCVGRNFNANPNLLMQHMKMEKLNVHPQQAPPGALIVWDKGCNGYHSVHGHIEIAIGGGRACSDFCGTIPSGGDSCSSVFIPVN